MNFEAFDMVDLRAIRSGCLRFSAKAEAFRDEVRTALAEKDLQRASDLNKEFGYELEYFRSDAEGSNVKFNDGRELRGADGIAILQFAVDNNLNFNELSAYCEVEGGKLVGLKIENPANALKSVAALSICKNLKHFVYTGVNTSYSLDISPLLTSAGLKELKLSTSGIQDRSVISKFSELRELSLCDAGCTDISFVSELKELQSLSLKRNPISDISPLAGLRKLINLDLSNTAITSIAALSNCPDLEILGLRDCCVDNIAALAACKKLDRLTLSYNPVRDLSPLTGLKNLCFLYLNRCHGIESFAPLLEISSLRQLSVFGISGCHMNEHLSELARSGVFVDFGKV